MPLQQSTVWWLPKRHETASNSIFQLNLLWTVRGHFQVVCNDQLGKHLNLVNPWSLTKITNLNFLRKICWFTVFSAAGHQHKPCPHDSFSVRFSARFVSARNFSIVWKLFLPLVRPLFSRLADFPTGSTCRTGGLAMTVRRSTRHVVFFTTPWLQHVEKRATNTMSCGILLAVWATFPPYTVSCKEICRTQVWQKSCRVDAAIGHGLVVTCPRLLMLYTLLSISHSPYPWAT